MAEYLTRSLRCPSCGTAFAVDVPRPGRQLGRDTDLRPRYEGPSPLAAAVETCPSCRFSGAPEWFGGQRDEEDDDEALKESFPLPWRAAPELEDDALDGLRRWIGRGEHLRGLSLADREPTAAERLVVAARCREYLREEDNLGAAGLWLLGSWCARAEKNPRVEAECQREAMARLEAALNERQVPEAYAAKAVFLLGELARRMGDFPRALDLLARVPEFADTDEPEGRLLRVLARRQATLATMKSTVNGSIQADRPSDADDEDGS